jgi:hypothetical protein
MTDAPLEPPYPYEVIEWVDSSGAGHWKTLPQSKPPSLTRCISVGWVIGETKECVEIASTWSPEDDTTDEQCCGDMTIPKVAIVSRTKATLPKRRGRK